MIPDIHDVNHPWPYHNYSSYNPATPPMITLNHCALNSSLTQELCSIVAMFIQHIVIMHSNNKIVTNN